MKQQNDIKRTRKISLSNFHFFLSFYNFKKLYNIIINYKLQYIKITINKFYVLCVVRDLRAVHCGYMLDMYVPMMNERVIKKLSESCANFWDKIII